MNGVKRDDDDDNDISSTKSFESCKAKLRGQALYHSILLLLC
jgi:hypothetical protein